MNVFETIARDDVTKIPRLRTYEDAAKHYEWAVTQTYTAYDPPPLRTDGQFRDYFQIHKNYRGEIVLRAHGSADVVTYKPDGGIVVDLSKWRNDGAVHCLVKGALGADVTVDPILNVMFAGEYVFAPDKPFKLKNGRLPRDRVGLILEPGKRVLPKWEPEYRQLQQWRKDHESVKRFMPKGWLGILVNTKSQYYDVLFLPPEKRAQYEPPKDSSVLIEHIFFELKSTPSVRDSRLCWVVSREKAKELVENGDAWPLDS